MFSHLGLAALPGMPICSFSLSQFFVVSSLMVACLLTVGSLVLDPCSWPAFVLYFEFISFPVLHLGPNLVCHAAGHDKPKTALADSLHTLVSMLKVKGRGGLMI